MFKMFSYVLALTTLVVAFKSQPYFDPLPFIDLASILILVLPSLMCVLNFSTRELKLSIQALFSARPQPEAVLETALQFCQSLGKYQLGMLFFTWLIALIVILPINQVKLMPSVGHQLAIMLISSLYLICFKLCVLLPMQSIIKRKLILLQSQVMS